MNKNKPASSNNPTVLKTESRMSQSTSAYGPSNTSSSNMVSSGRVVYSYKKDAWEYCICFNYYLSIVKNIENLYIIYDIYR